MLASDRLIRTTAITLSLLLLIACTQQKNDAIHFGLESSPITLDPRFATDAISYRISRLIYRSLIDFNQNFEFIPDLACWEILNPQHYRFTLIKGDPNGRRFHSGEKLTAHDVKATYESILDPNTESPHRNSIVNIEQIVVVDEDTIDFFLKESDPLFPAKLVIGIMPASLIAVDHPFNQNPIGSDSIAFHEWLNDNQLSLKRLDDNQIIKFITVKDSTVRVLKILRKELDIVQGNIPKEILNWLSKKKSIDIATTQGNIFTYIGFNIEDKITGNIKIRKAIAHAINRDAIIQYIMGDSARKAGSIFPPTHWVGHPEISGIAFDPIQAKKLLKASGYDEKNPLQINYKTSNNPFRVRLATIIQHQLKAVGIKINVHSHDWGTFYGNIKNGNFQMYSLSWVGLKTPDIFRYVFHSTSLPPNGANRGRFNSPIADAMIENAEAHQNLSEQAKYYKNLQAYLLERLPYIPLWYEGNLLITSKNIHGYKISTDGHYDSLHTVKKLDF